eukprot:1583523-Alexandrium_andersonii.AAC.1
MAETPRREASPPPPQRPFRALRGGLPTGAPGQRRGHTATWVAARQRLSNYPLSRAAPEGTTTKG